MQYLNTKALDQIDAHAFQTQHPFPWVNPAGLLTAGGFQALCESMPTLDQFERIFGKRRRYGQKPHDRMSLEYSPDMHKSLSPAWQAFMDELKSPLYQRFMARLLGTSDFELQYHWHYTPASCSVSPHCDAKYKLGSHIFYFNTEKDWRPEWGGQTVVLDDGGRFDYRSAPAFEDFDKAIDATAMGNYSFIFVRNGNSWHGVREITCPEGHYRKVFIVVIRKKLSAIERLASVVKHLGTRRAYA